MEFRAASHALLQSMKEAEEINKSLQKSSQKLLQIEKNRENLEHVMTPLLTQSTEFEQLAGSVDRAIEPADCILQALQSIREMETALMGDPLKDLQKYAKTMADLEEQLRYIKRDYPTMVEALLGAFHAVDKDRISNSYNMHTLKEILQGLEIDPQSFIKIGSEIVDSGLEKLETVFMSILVKKNNPVDLHGEKYAEMEGDFLFVDMEDVGLLQMIAEILESFGRAKKCLKIYGAVRVESMRASFKSMAADYLRYNSASSIDKLEWTALEDHVADWLVVLRKTVKVLVRSERKLCSRIFETFDMELWTDFFQKLVLGSGMKALIEFGEAVALSQREPQKLFKLLDMVEGLETLNEDYGVVFEGPGCLEIRLRLCEMEKQLVHSACQVLWDFGKQVEGDSGLFVDGTPPKLTSYVVNYLKFMLTEYEEVTAKVWGMENNTSLSEVVGHVMDSLELSLETRAKGYNASGLAHIFLMNNYWYIFKRARDSKLGILLGEAWLKQRKRLVNQHVLGYEKDVWVPLVKHLNRDGLDVSSGGRGGARDLFKQRIRSFNSALEKLYEEHKNWVISDDELREGTFTKIVQAVIPAYRNYIDNFSKLFDHSANGSKHLRYSPEQLEFMLSNLFTQRSSRTGLSN